MKEVFRKIATKVSRITGSAGAFLFACGIVVSWALSGPRFNYSDTWQLIINTGTTIGTFLMVFLIQNTQNRDGKAAQLKLDELVRITRARDEFMGLENLNDDEIDALDREFRVLHEKQLASPLMKKLHTNIIAAHKKRTVIQEAGHTLNMLNPLSTTSPISIVSHEKNK
ncbi:low affinity iron permease family protein [Candidatus Saccharibacteria bacterium]|jgi:low affinity Fe/Cu permease|nr:low affinity iron permease family protein [Candidatus Saccharibacteria bacterium]